MLNAQDLKEYRLLKGLSQRDVAMYCDVTSQLIGDVERGEKNLTEYNYQEIVKGINAASQAKARGTFEADKKRLMKAENDYEKNRQKEKRAAEKAKTTTTRKKTTTTKPTASKKVSDSK